MAWCRQATSHYLSQCWPRSLPPYGVTKPQWVKHNVLFSSGWGILCEIVLRWMSMDLTDNKSTLVEVMTWGGQAQTIDWAHVDPDLCSHITITNSYLKKHDLDKHFFPQAFPQNNQIKLLLWRPETFRKKIEQLERLHSEIPPAASWLPILVIHIRSQVKTRQSESYKLKKIAKNCNFEILQEPLYATHLLKLLGKMYKYEMDPARTVGATERTCDAGWTRDGCGTDGRTNRQTDRVKPIYPPTTSLCGRYNKTFKSMQFTCIHSKDIKVHGVIHHWMRGHL